MYDYSSLVEGVDRWKETGDSQALNVDFSRLLLYISFPPAAAFISLEHDDNGGRRTRNAQHDGGAPSRNHGQDPLLHGYSW